MSDPISSYPAVMLHGVNDRRIGDNEEVVIAPSSSEGRIVFSPPLSRSPSPYKRRPQPLDEVEPRVLGQKTLDFFSNPFTTSSSYPTPIHKEHPRTDRTSTISSFSSSSSSSSSSSATSFDDDPDRPPSPVRPDSLTYGFFFKEHVPPPAELPPPRTGLLKIPRLERFFPSRVGRRLRGSEGWGFAEPGSGGGMGDFLLVDPDYNTVGPPPPCMAPSLKIDVEPIGSPESLIRDFIMLDDLPSMVSSPVPSSPLTESPPPLTPSPPLTPESPTPKAEKDEMEFEELKLDGPVVFAEGMIIGNELLFQLIRLLGIGAFSNVWLARDILHKLERVGDRPKTDIKKRERLEARRGDRTAHGLRPPISYPPTGTSLERSSSIYFKAKSAVARSDKNAMTQEDHDYGRLVALKMIDRTLCDTDDRTRISFMREVEILRHISHPSIVSYLYSFSIPTHHCLVLEALQGGELFDLMGQADNYSRMTEPLVRRIYGELCNAVGWMHSVDLVHRDVKLENILFTTNPFLPNAVLPSPTCPLIKLTDFGLARFIDPAQPMLTTRCGSESYAAPELIMCKPYDGRQTDAWACGVVLYALGTCVLPFDNPPNGGMSDTRRAFLSRIARVGYSWPRYEDAPLATEGLRDVVKRFLVKDPVRRATLAEIWDEPWMRGEGAPPPPVEAGRLVGGEVPMVAREESMPLPL
ncbi:hypothetical protein M422DRAFT_54881 [Sphaerobolus stellatus SS14]|uniref:Protein kinase domain-containing protein n=1 Tax=Sphaerobolus stellatus (strain SS14) TaxID=990650 RepID=A0A0C9UFV7_SPHS4|nr:hypothetical protein M422DRAFT_54881 [Sphaerobolus stellatus SS14]